MCAYFGTFDTSLTAFFGNFINGSSTFTFGQVFWQVLLDCDKSIGKYCYIVTSQLTIRPTVTMCQVYWQALLQCDRSIVTWTRHGADYDCNRNHRRGSRIFERGGGVQARIQDFSQAPPPWTLSA